MKIQEQSVGEIAARRPGAIEVFYRYGIEFCCGGGVPFSRVCEEKGLDPDKVLKEIEEAGRETGGDFRAWEEASTAEIVSHLLEGYHVPQRERLDQCAEWAVKVARVHEEKDPRLLALRDTFLALRDELLEHFDKEEELLFPAIVAGNPEKAAALLDSLSQEHEEAGASLEEIRKLSDGFVVPPQACNTWRALLQGLEKLERGLHEHIHLENNVLFPKVRS